MIGTNLPPDTAPVVVSVVGVEAVTGMGKVRWLAIVDIEVAGVWVQLQGVRVVSTPAGLVVRPPVFRHPVHGWTPCATMPPAVTDALAASVLAAVWEAAGWAPGRAGAGLPPPDPRASGGLLRKTAGHA